MKILFAPLLAALLFSLNAAVAQKAAHAAPGDSARMPFGDCVVLALSDVEGSADASLLIGLDRSRRAQLVPSGKLKSFINVFVVITPTHTVLIDTGMGDRGKALEAMEREGIARESVDAVLLTHLHIDHVSGALLENGAPRYPNAQVWLAEEEAAYWTSDEIMMAQPRAVQPSFHLPRAVLNAYGYAVHAFAPNQVILPGITATTLPGHTAGHSGFLLESQGNQMLFWGDIMHFAEVQFAEPGIAVSYDQDPERAVATRQALLNRLYEEHISFAGTHLPFPGAGNLEKSGNGFIFLPRQH